VLEIGTGSGFIAIQIADKVKKIIATDISKNAIKTAKKNSKLNGVNAKIDFRIGDLFSPIEHNEKFSLIIFNAPYLPTKENEKIGGDINYAWDGGLSGRKIISRFIHECPQYMKANGRVLLVQSDLADINSTISEFKKVGLDAKVIAEKKFFFEKIVLIIGSKR